MILRTEIKFKKSIYSINHEDKIVSIGSCFSENIGKKLSYYQFNVDVNSHGILFNPISIIKALQDVLDQKEYTKYDLDAINGKWFSYNHHSSFSDANYINVLAKINDKIKIAHKHLKKSNYLLITFGTAFLYENKILREPVANCHKVPNYNFDKKLLNLEEIVEPFWDILIKIKKLNPSLKVIFTLSPVRHIKEGIVENNQSKAILLSAIHKLVHDFENVSYFPSYEIMMDDLRDYRFYESDMIHPNQLAIDYIWDKFSEVYFTEETKAKLKEIHSIKRDLAHRPFDENSKEFMKFKLLLDNKIKDFNLSNPTIKPL